MENEGSVAKMIEPKIAKGINILLEHKSIGYLDHFLSYMWTKMYMCKCVYVDIYMYIWTKAYVHKSIGYLDHFLSYMWTKMYMCKCVYVDIYMYIWTKAYVQKHENFPMYAYEHICCADVNKCT